MVKTYENLEKITVLFENKTTARDHGAVFGEDRNWYIPENISEANKAILRTLDKPVTEKTVSSVSVTESDEKTTPNTQENASTSMGDGYDFSKVIRLNNSLMAAYAIQRHGLPSDTETRTALLNALRRREPGQYPIEYEAMLQCSEEFARVYNEDYVTDLIRNNIKSTGKIEESVMSAENLTAEEKALLLLVLPL